MLCGREYGLPKFVSYKNNEYLLMYYMKLNNDKVLPFERINKKYYEKIWNQDLDKWLALEVMIKLSKKLEDNDYVTYQMFHDENPQRINYILSFLKMREIMRQGWINRSVVKSY